MRILYIDIDSLRPDHLGCYGYHRATSPTLDRIAAEGVRFTGCYTPDAPCLPSRSALFSGRFGIHTGVVNHGGVAAQPFIEGPGRGFRDRFGATSWPARFRQLGYRAASISPFGERHSAWHWYAGFNEVINTGGGGNECADVIHREASGWLDRHGAQDDWFLHVNFWDPHTPYRVPESYGNPFEGDAPPGWLTEDIRRAHWEGGGPHGAREVMGYDDAKPAYLKEDLPRQPLRMDSLEQVKRMFDGYDTGVRYADDHVGRLLDQLAGLGVLDDTVIVVSADHGENLGELNVYGDHQTADHITCRVPMIVRWPGITDAQAGRVDDGLYYTLDVAASLVELAGGEPDPDGDGRSFASAFRAGESAPRDHLVVSQAAWCAQRGVRFGDHLYVRTYHDAWHDYPDEMLFNLAEDPHECTDLCGHAPEMVDTGRGTLAAWKDEMMATATHPVDPMDTVLAEGGPLHARQGGATYLDRLRATGRAEAADRLATKHGVG